MDPDFPKALDIFGIAPKHLFYQPKVLSTKSNYPTLTQTTQNRLLYQDLLWLKVLLRTSEKYLL